METRDEDKEEVKVELVEFPTQEDRMEVKRRTLVTVGKTVKNPPTEEWEKRLLAAMHSPIRRLFFSFYMEVPYWVSVHFCRHVHAQPYVQTQRNDRQDKYNRNEAPQSAPVKMILDMNAEELITIMHKRLCAQASLETRRVAEMMRAAVLEKCPEFSDVLVPNCVYRNGLCTEFKPCGAAESLLKRYKEEVDKKKKLTKNSIPL